ncbi:TetR/AcrR family transcriptional regulator [Nocardia seriolae]|uniref:TetR family transcriptional regulator n=1 Tax=Nocardia seriolae TaxID=37332 RepID=A0A0B8NEI5_9NOCA|nr:TetR/AcrR family transcriptional regulator [Nocardia seriolae]MTJ63714.1 TetR family transcriptional regulator [Nocardia seriolae]MTJ75839.1 TetR family transcriptional regulator [Nocardia seriolae]MTJ88280.1 TetR family transcriptional regulator [Nocardia seriolae]MTK32266.1 TetR family transcriptional regulator [Nocardia seriolae]MTK41603.1 TetR family transcriptional regulator [Nocardia seriolae]
MPRPPDHARRAQLLEGVIAYIADRGLTELSLRPLAEYLGTSSRMLIHYFGTKEAMLIAALETQRPDIAALFSGVDSPAVLRDRLSASFAINTAGEFATSLPVLLQVLGAATVPDSPFKPYATDAIEVLITAMTNALTRIDPTIPDPEASATLLISGMRGLIQDWWVTGDTSRVERSVNLLIAQAIPG